jgi:hypothetical protein
VGDGLVAVIINGDVGARERSEIGVQHPRCAVDHHGRCDPPARPARVARRLGS